MDFDADIRRAQSAIMGNIYSNAPEASPLVSLSLQSPLAIVLLLLSAVFGGFYFSSTCIKSSIGFAALASLALSFGAIFLVDAVRVYTG